MHTYICTKTYDGNTEAGHHAHINVGEILLCIAGRIARHNASVCLVTSYVAHQYFAINDDGRGMERGYLTYEIAFAPREREHDDGYIYRFSQDELDMLCAEYPHWLKQQAPLLFNHDFFQADVEELKELAARLGITIKKGDEKKCTKSQTPSAA